MAQEKGKRGRENRAKSGVVEHFSSQNFNRSTHYVAVGTAERSKTGQRASYRAVCEGKTAVARRKFLLLGELVFSIVMTCFNFSLIMNVMSAVPFFVLLGVVAPFPHMTDCQVETEIIVFVFLF